MTNSSPPSSGLAHTARRGSVRPGAPDAAAPRAERGAFTHFLILVWMETRIVCSYLWLYFRSTVLRWPPSEAERSAWHRNNARRFKDTACRLKGANVKVGQIASMQTHLLPKEFIEELRDLRDAVTPSDSRAVLALIRQELGKPASQLFAEFDSEPIATASMGQVHLARLGSGLQVVVKVLHPGLERTVEIDLALIRGAIRLLGWLAPRQIDLGLLVREAEEPLRRELDLAHEGRATETLAAELEPMGVIVPRVHWDYTSRRVLTLDFIEGVNIDDRAQLDAWGVDRAALMTIYLQSFVQQALRGGYFHADPHPGNVFCTPEGKLALLDFGMVQRLPDHVRTGLLKELLGGFFARPRLWAAGMIEKGAVGESERGKLEEFAKEAFIDPRARAMIFDHQLESRGEMGEVVARFAEFFKSLETLQTPRDNVMFMRAIGIIIDVMKEVAPEHTPSEIAQPVMMPVLSKLIEEHPEFLSELEAPAALPAGGTG